LRSRAVNLPAFFAGKGPWIFRPSRKPTPLLLSVDFSATFRSVSFGDSTIRVSQFAPVFLLGLGLATGFRQVAPQRKSPLFRSLPFSKIRTIDFIRRVWCYFPRIWKDGPGLPSRRLLFCMATTRALVTRHRESELPRVMTKEKFLFPYEGQHMIGPAGI